MIAGNRRSFIKKCGFLAVAPALGAHMGGPGAVPVQGPAMHRIMSCNIRVALAEDEEKGVGWSQRKSLCIQVIKGQSPDLIGLQEVLRVQNEDLKKALPDFFSFGFEGPEMDTGDNDYHGIAKNPIFFSKKRYELLSAGSYWLSETPLIAGSISWESARARNASWIRLKDKKTGKDFRVINIHLDHKAQGAKEKQIELVMSEAGQYSEGYPQILTGDFNATMRNPVYQKIKAAGWVDTHSILHGDQEAGFTMHSFKGSDYKGNANTGRIDFIFSKGEVKTEASQIIRGHNNQLYPSDHYFMMADIRIP
ncbi:endonuclease/exonuclease/phosphatase family protein [Dyadobacter tibetensis]|uniref:endonuclease/exonuclease/phosphatase family protein n=1 Tax=Dyadobacter tibetensis TaxID=1211851 RepID=UPI00046F1F59|nr:endonuclease/exonuclease/phosphatase family protein [Dyadobacter tibetensis]